MQVDITDWNYETDLDFYLPFKDSKIINILIYGGRLCITMDMGVMV
jgi:hypothetical protein